MNERGTVGSDTLWFGVHLPVNHNAHVSELVEAVPALAVMGVNVLIIEVNYNYAYVSHPELRSDRPVTPDHAQRLVDVCCEYGIRLIPQFQCLGHQSWREVTFPLLVRYPEFDETPGQFPNNEGIYCRSWCPQHPGVNPIVFALFDELITALEADAVHVGMDEVFLIASEHCPRCQGHDPAELFAQAVNDYYGHLVDKCDVAMLMWGDRLLNDAEMGYGKWEAAQNGTDPAIDWVPQDVIICDWHYTQRDRYPSIPLFLQQGFRVWPAGWKDVEATRSLIADARRYQDNPNMLGYLCTTWGAVQPDELTAFPPLRAAAEEIQAW
jgi:hypothetical protein